MSAILQALYRGKLRLGEMGEAKSAERQRMECMFLDKQQQFLDRLDQEMKRECLCLFERTNAISACDCEQSYIEGMCMGARLTAELLLANEWD